MKLLE
jgi:hypothetical protein